jgi:septal ring factor EnvC (AmiA/AmiB activator)
VGAGVRAAADGLITYAGPALPKHGDAKIAQTIVLEHADGTESTYTAALSDALVAGARVLRGQWLGKLAPSAAPASLRFSWQRAGKAIDPTPVLVGP